MYEKHSSMYEPNDDDIIWKYMTFSKFVNMLDGTLYFNRIDKFEDVFEGRWPKLNEKYIKYMVEHNEKNVGSFDEVMRKLTYVSCFHKSNYETAFMWKQYSYDDGLAIQTNIKRLKKAFHLTAPSIFISDVHYIDYEKEYIEDMSNMFFLANHKRRSFEFEKEVRCMCLLEYWDKEGKILEEYRDNKSENKIDFSKTPTGIKVPIDLTALIERIYLSPYAPEYLEENITMLVNRFGLNVEIVKSELYKIK